MNLKEILARCEHLFEDLNFTAVKEWKTAAPGRKVIRSRLRPTTAVKSGH